MSRHHLKMLGSEVVRDRRCLLKRLDDDHAAPVVPGLAGKLPRAQRGALTGNRRDHGASEVVTRRHQDGDGVRIVLALGEQIDSHRSRISGVVGDDEYLGGPASMSMPTLPVIWRFAS